MRVSLNQTTTRPVLLSFTQAALLGTFQRLFYEGHHDTRVASRLAKETPQNTDCGLMVQPTHELDRGWLRITRLYTHSHCRSQA